MSKNQQVKSKPLTDEELEALIEEATVDCYGDYECLTGFSTMIEDNVQFSFPGKVVGEEVTVTGITEDDNTILAICKRKNRKYKVNILEVKFNHAIVKGSKWIEAYTEWKRHN